MRRCPCRDWRVNSPRFAGRKTWCPAKDLPGPERRTRVADSGRFPMGESALVLFSGGQDSTVCLAWALDRFGQVETIGFDYGQRHVVELACRKEILMRL